MPRLTRHRRAHPEELRRRGQFFSVVGEIESSIVETSIDPRKVDHVWINVRAGADGLVRIALNTCSLKNRDAGFDSRVRLGSIVSPWDELPALGVRRAKPLDYSVIEAVTPVTYREQDQITLEGLLLDRAGRAILLEAWGEFYFQESAGLHQLHSRRGSYGMPKDHVGRDGAVQFYFAEPREREMLLFKFAGQP